MQGKNLYEYAVIRIVPRIEREEFLNVGVITFCKSPRFLKVLFHIDRERISAFCKDVDFQVLEKHLLALEHVCKGAKEGGPVAEWDIKERFRWLTAVRSSLLQTSRPHNGFSSDMEKTTQCLFEELVL